MYMLDVLCHNCPCQACSFAKLWRLTPSLENLQLIKGGLFGWGVANSCNGISYTWWENGVVCWFHFFMSLFCVWLISPFSRIFQFHIMPSKLLASLWVTRGHFYNNFTALSGCTKRSMVILKSLSLVGNYLVQFIIPGKNL